jgi:hypothetical protein
MAFDIKLLRYEVAEDNRTFDDKPGYTLKLFYGKRLLRSIVGVPHLPGALQKLSKAEADALGTLIVTKTKESMVSAEPVIYEPTLADVLGVLEA